MPHYGGQVQRDRPTTSSRDGLEAVGALSGVVMGLDVVGERVEATVGIEVTDGTEVLAHFHNTLDELTGVMLPALGEVLQESWDPARWWATAGGERVVLGRDGRCLVVDGAA